MIGVGATGLGRRRKFSKKLTFTENFGIPVGLDSKNFTEKVPVRPKIDFYTRKFAKISIKSDVVRVNV